MSSVDLEKVRSLVEPILTELGYELIDLRLVTEHGRMALRLMIDREVGVTVGDCQRVSREIDTLLEVEGAVRGSYDLEVSSPGFDRPLTKEADFLRYTGRIISLKTQQPIEGRSNYKGLLKGMEDQNVVMIVDRKEYRVPLALVAKAHLVYES